MCYQIGVGQSYNEQPTDDQLQSLLNGVRFALANPDRTAEQNHDNWMQYKIAQGWVYGPVKDAEKKEHPDLVPFKELPDIEQRKDIMDNVVNRLAEVLWQAVYECWAPGQELIERIRQGD